MRATDPGMGCFASVCNVAAPVIGGVGTAVAFGGGVAIAGVIAGIPNDLVGIMGFGCRAGGGVLYALSRLHAPFGDGLSVSIALVGAALYCGRLVTHM